MDLRSLLFLFLILAVASPRAAFSEDELDEALLEAEAEGKVSESVKELPAPAESAPAQAIEPSSEVAPKSSAAEEIDDSELSELEQDSEKTEAKSETKSEPGDQELQELESETLAEPAPTEPLKAPGPQIALPLKPAKPAAEPAPLPVQGDPERTLTCCRTTDRYPLRFESGVKYELKRRADCVDTTKTKEVVEPIAHACRQEMKCCQLPNLGHVYSLDCKPDQIIENTDRCEERRMKKRMRVCCATVQEDGWIAVEGWLQRKRCHQRDGQMLSLPQELCEQLRTEPR